MKKIAFVFDGMGQGGVERIGIDYIKICKSLGYEVDVYNLNPPYNASLAYLPGDVKVYNRRYSRILCPEIYSYGVQKWWWGKYAYVLISPFLTLLQLVMKFFTKKRKYDVAIAIAGHINDLNYVTKGFIKSNKKICWCHGNILSYFAICDAYPMLYKKIDKFVVLSSAGQKDIYPGHKFMYAKDICKIYNPTFMSIENCDFNIVNELKNKYGDFVLMVARAEYRKGFDIAIKAMKKLYDLGVNKRIVFVGTGDELEKYKQIAIDEGIGDNCIFEGFKTNVQDYIAASYINLLTSKWEGLPTVIVEAMALGKPCVMTNSDDGEVSSNGNYCLLTEVDDIDSVAQSLYTLYTDSSEYEKYSRLSKERSKDFSPEKIAMKVKEML